MLLKEDILEFINEFHLRGKISKGQGAKLIVHIPKTVGDIGVKDYRPISLIGSIYKILAKALAERLQKALPWIISKEK